MTSSFTTLIQPAALAAALGRPLLAVVDCRFSLANPSAGEEAYRIAHIPGARYAHLDRDLSGPHAAGAGRHPWPRAEAFTATLSAWGISPAHQVVAYDDGDGAHAARLWFLLRAMGHRDVAVLDGGWRQWTEAGYETDAVVPSPLRSEYTAAFDAALLLDVPAVQAHLEAGGVLLDARASERFRGEVEPIDPVAGHVPGAINRPYVSNLLAGRFKDAAALHAEFEALLGSRRPEEVVAMCGSGVTACHHLLAMMHAGLPGAKLFTGSWSGWVEDPARPVATSS